MILSVFIKYLCIRLYHKCKVEYIELGVVVLVSLTQWVGTMHNICKVWGLKPDHHKKKKN